jgi:chromosome segregation ATPase
MESLLQLNIQQKHATFLRSSMKQIKENHSSTVSPPRENLKQKVAEIESELKQKNLELENILKTHQETQKLHKLEMQEKDFENEKLKKEIESLKVQFEKQKKEITTRQTSLMAENEKIIVDNVNLKTDLEKMKNGFQDLVSMYKKEKAENSKKTKQVEELKKHLLNPPTRISPLVRQSPFRNTTNENNEK